MAMSPRFVAGGPGGGVFKGRAMAKTAALGGGHVAAARAGAGDRHDYIFNSLCVRPSAGPNAGSVDEASPDPSVFHAEPVKVFDNLYFVGEKEYSAWAVTTSEGIILVDTIWDYSVADKVVGGLKKLGFDPA